MANSFSVLLAYIDNLMWLCTQLFCGIVFIIEFNYKLVAAVFKGCVQLWGWSVQAVINLVNAFVFSIEFLAELPVKSFHVGKYFLELSKNLMNNASQAFMAWCWMTLTYCVKMFTAFFMNLGTAIFSTWTKLFDTFVFRHTQITDIISSFMNTIYDHIKKAKTTTVDAMHSVGTDVQESMLGFCKGLYEYFITGLTYPIALLNTCAEGILGGLYFCVSLLKAVGDSVVRVFEDVIEIVDSSSTSIANGLYDILHTLKEIATFPIKVIYYISQVLAAVFDSTAEGYFSPGVFITKNWGALLALALCVTLVWFTIYMTGQHERNIQHILRDLTQLVNSFTHSQPLEINREPVRPESHLQHDIHPHGQQQGEPRGRNEGDEQNADDAADQDMPINAMGEDNQPGPSRPRQSPHTPYSLRSRPFTPPPSGENGAVESIMSNLKHKLSVEQERKTCVVCLDAIKNTLFLPCRHLCVCVDCAKKIVSSEDILFRQCPLCRSRIGSVLEVYS